MLNEVKSAAGGESNQATESTEDNPQIPVGQVTQMAADKNPQPKVRYEVEWCTEPKFDDCGDIIPDLCKYNVRYFAKLSSAIRYAEIVYKECYFGAAQIRKEFYNLRNKEWERDWTFGVMEIS